MLKKTIFISLIIAIILILGWFLFSFFTPFSKVKSKPEVLPPVFSIVGEVTAINESSFQIKTLKDQNSFGADKDFIILIASSTVFSGIEIPETVSAENAHQPILAKEMDFSNLKIKDNVAVESDINLRDINQFTAKSVQILKNIE